MERINEVVSKFLQELSAKKAAFPGDSIDEGLKNILTKDELKHIRFNTFKSGTLYLAVDSSAMLYALTVRKQAVLDELKSQSAAIKDVKFRLGEVKG